jgi:signal transduction histidine kinase
VRSGQIWWTPEVYDIVGVDYDFDLSFRSVLRFYEPSARSTLMSAVRDCLRHGESYDVEIPIVTAGGEQRWLRVRGEAEREEGEVTWMFGAVQDVTERKLRERRLQEAKEAAERAQQQAEASREEAERQRRRAEAASRSKSRFLAGVAHDLKTPLTSIDGFADVLVDRLSGEDEHHARLIRESAATIGEMADSLMELSRLEAGGLNVDTRPIDVRPVLEAVVDLFRERAEKRGVDLQLSLPQNPVVADVDDDLLARAVTNLVENAVKYVRSGDRVDVWVSAAASDRDDLAPKATASGIIGDRQINGTPAGTVETDEAVVIGVDDDGPGMEPEFVDKMFEPFSRNRLDTEGTGLGLAVTRELVEAIGGEIEGDSELGRGTWFRIRLPVAGVEDGPAPHTPASDPGSDAPDADK